MAAVNYKLIKNFFNKDELKVYQKYCYNKVDQNKDYQIDNQSFSPAWYHDPLMTALLDTKLPSRKRKWLKTISYLRLLEILCFWCHFKKTYRQAIM